MPIGEHIENVCVIVVLTNLLNSGDMKAVLFAV